jgi:predicted DNA-binding protein YlxM (UPF0122 family)
MARRAEVWRLRAEGVAIAEIARRLKVTRTTIWTDMKRTAAELNEKTLDLAEHNRQIDLERIDVAMRAVMPKVQSGDLRAVDTMTRLIEQRAKLLGYYAAQKVDLTTNGEPLKVQLEVVETAS